MWDASQTTLSVRWEQEGDTVLLTPDGDAGFRQAEALRDALARVAAERPRRVVLNLSRLDFISSAGMGVLVSFKHALARDGATLTLAAVPPPIFDVLHAAGLYRRQRQAADRSAPL
jgi:anti-anti-sigma factor